MLIPRRFLVVLGSFLAVFASGPFAPTGADPAWPQLHLESSAPVQVEAAGRPDLSGEQAPTTAGSTVDAAPTAPPPTNSPSYPLVLNSQVQHFLDRFTRDQRDIVGIWLSRSSRYLGMIREVLRSRGLPEDLAFTAMIESGFNPVAVSRAGAVGLWQFMASTARRYGLRVDNWVDERLDPEKSTLAAAAYLRDLYQQFGSWTLAQAAYNAGEMNVAKAIRATGSNDFWALSRSRFLARETKEYVPQIQAATVIGRDPNIYGFPASDTVVTSFETIAVPASTDLRRLAPAAGLSFDLLRSLNPTLVRGVTPPGGPFALKVPLGTGPGVLLALDSAKSVPVIRAASRNTRLAREPRGPSVLRAAVRKSDVHVVRRRDTVTSIARRYGVSVSDLVRWNSLEKNQRIRPGDRLRLDAGEGERSPTGR